MDRPAQWALVGAAWFLALSVALFGYLTWRTLARRAGPGAAVAAIGAASAAAGAAGAVTALDPVTGRRIVVGPDTPRVDYQGKTYYFSTDKDAQGLDARTRFLMNPEAWLKGQGQGSAAGAGTDSGAGGAP